MKETQKNSYQLGRNTSLLGVKFVEFLYQTEEGARVRKELERDFLTWQKETQELPTARENLMTFRQFINKMFPENIKVQKVKKKKIKKIKKEKKKMPPKKVVVNKELKFRNT